MKRILPWVLATVLVAGLAGAVVLVASPPSVDAQLESLSPDDLGTTWVYRTTTDGHPTGLHVEQITGTTLTSSARNGIVVEHFWDDLLGNGPRHLVQYLALQGHRVLEIGNRIGNTASDDDPPAPLLVAPLRPGRTWTYAGKILLQPSSIITKVVGIETVQVMGRTIGGCPHLHATHRATDANGKTTVEVVDSWLCPGFGAVKSTDRIGGTVEQEVLAEFHGPRGNFGSGGLPPPMATPGGPAGPGVDQGRTNSVPGPRSGATLVTDRYAWTISRKTAILYPPVGTSGLLVLAEDDGTVSAVDPNTGAVAWQLQLKAPIVAPPVIAGGLVLVADSSKSLFALDARTGAARWVASFRDLVSTAPVVSAGVVATATEDNVLHALRLRDGHELRTVDINALATTPPALSGNILVVAEQSGDVTAFTLPNLNEKWSTQLTGTLAAGPVVGGGLVVVAQTGGQLSAFALDDGKLRWRAASPGDLPGPPALAQGTLVEVAGHFVVGRSLGAGSEVWRERIGPEVSAPPMIVGRQVVVVDVEATLHTFALSDGLPGPARTLPPPDASTEIQTEIPMSYVGGSLVIPSHNNGPWPFTILFAFPVKTTGRGAASGIRFAGEIRGVPTAPVAAPILDHGHVLMAGAIPAGVYDVPATGPAKTLVRSASSVVSAVPAGDLVLAQVGEELEAIPRAGGAPRWKFSTGLPSPAQHPVVVGQTAVAPIFGQGLVGLDLETGKVRWTRSLAGSAGRSSPLVLSDGNVAYAVGGLSVLDPATGRIVWRIPDVNAFAPISSDGDSIFAEVLTSRGPVLAAVDAATGTVRWTKPFDVTINTGPAAGNGVVAAVDSANVLAVFDQDSGSKLWSVALRTAPNGDPVVALGRVVLQEQGRFENIQQRDFRLSAWDARTGRLEAQWELPGSGFTQAGFGASGDTILAPGITTQSAIFLLQMEER